MAEKKYYIKEGEKIYTTGAYLRREPSIVGCWVVDGFEDDSYYDGRLVNWDENARPYVVEE